MDLIVVGCQAGDEGKGKLTDILCENAHAVVRYQAGPANGHTVVTRDGEYRFVQVPAGVLRGAIAVLGNGCVIDPGKLVAELDDLAARGVRCDLRISESVHVVMPYHLLLDQAWEAWRGGALATSGSTGFATGHGQLGSTKTGLGPCREDKMARVGLRVVDLLDRDLLHARLSRLVPLKRAVLERAFGMPAPETTAEQDVEAWTEAYHAYGRRLAPTLCDVSAFLAEARAAGRVLVYEGCQSVGLDVEHGTYPYVSSGYASATGVTVGTGSSPRVAFDVIGVAKAYLAQVGGGPLPTELDGETADHLVERGREYGTVTGRRRRVGWFDVPFARRAVLIDGIERLFLTNLDVLAGLPEVRVATHYQIDGRRLDVYPRSHAEMARIEPVYTTLPGWPDADWSTLAAKGFDALPAELRRYVELIASELGVRMAALGVGPRRDQTIALDLPVSI